MGSRDIDVLLCRIEAGLAAAEPWQCSDGRHTGDNTKFGEHSEAIVSCMEMT